MSFRIESRNSLTVETGLLLEGRSLLFEVDPSFAQAYASIDRVRLGRPISGREFLSLGFAPLANYHEETRPRCFQAFEYGYLVESEPGGNGRPTYFDWVDLRGRVVKANFR